MSSSIDAGKDYYKILGVPTYASTNEIRVAHKKQVLKYHPDTAKTFSNVKAEYFSDSITSSKFHDVTEAWNVLSKEELRKAYDALRNIPVTQHVNTRSSDVIGLNFSAKVAPRDNEWMKSQSKYKSQYWKKMSINDKKRLRTIPVHTISSAAMAVGVFPLAFICSVALGTFAPKLVGA